MDRAKLEALEKLLAKATPGEWMLATSCSWRRILTTLGGKPVIVPTVQRSDGHPDLECGQGYINAELAIAAVNALPALLRLARAAVDDGEFPAFLTHSQAWPQGYVHGFNDALLLVRQQGFGPRVDDDTLREFKGVVLRADAADTTAGE